MTPNENGAQRAEFLFPAASACPAALQTAQPAAVRVQSVQRGTFSRQRRWLSPSWRAIADALMQDLPSQRSRSARTTGRFPESLTATSTATATATAPSTASSTACADVANDVTFSAPKTHAERLLVSQAMGSTVCDASADQVGEARHG